MGVRMGGSEDGSEAGMGVRMGGSEAGGEDGSEAGRE